MSDSESFNKRLVRAQDRILDACNFIVRTRKQLDFNVSLASPKRKKRVVVAVAGLVVAAAAVLTILTLQQGAVTAEINGIEVLAGHWISSNEHHDTRLDFSDGSRINLRADSSLRIQNLQSEGAYLLLERGTLEATVAHRQDTDWRFYVGPYLIVVTGTGFDVNWNPYPREFHLKMREGSVRVEGPLIPTGTTLSAGERLYASLDNNRVEIAMNDNSALSEDIPSISPPIDESSVGGLSTNDAPPRIEKETAIVAEPQAPSKETANRGNRRRGRRAPSFRSTSWRKLAKQGSHAKVVALAEASGIPHILNTASAVDLLALGDAARHVGRYDLATILYKKVRRRFPKTAHASGAAFVLGKIAFDKRRAFAEASRWFRACLADARTGVLEGEALERLMESLHMSGDFGGARSVAETYLERFPKGPHASLARRLAGDVMAR
jgi:transmembrane sensor